MSKLIICVVLLWASAPAAAVQLDQRGCLEYAVWSRDLIWAREVGADREKVRASLIEMRDAAEAGAPVFTLLLRDFDVIWETRTPRQIVAQIVLRECIGRRGQYGEDS